MPSERRSHWMTGASDGVVVLHYKELAAQPVWLPPIDPLAEVLVTDPKGIQIFHSTPPDPLSSPPAEIELHAVRSTA